MNSHRVPLERGKRLSSSAKCIGAGTARCRVACSEQTLPSSSVVTVLALGMRLRFTSS